MQLPPPPWHGQPPPARLPEPAPSDPAALGQDALAELKALNDEPYDPPAPKGPPVQLAPLERPVFPKPDWRGEDKPA